MRQQLTPVTFFTAAWMEFLHKVGIYFTNAGKYAFADVTYLQFRISEHRVWIDIGCQRELEKVVGVLALQAERKRQQLSILSEEAKKVDVTDQRFLTMKPPDTEPVSLVEKAPRPRQLELSFP